MVLTNHISMSCPYQSMKIDFDQMLQTVQPVHQLLILIVLGFYSMLLVHLLNHLVLQLIYLHHLLKIQERIFDLHLMHLLLLIHRMPVLLP
ncbi:hypothetical protein B7462_05555 [Klebsiella pneumoniae]|nr:hypothetical protein B7462_05555 [Klebsiella pneumoniae]